MEKKILNTNRKAFHNYEILEKIEAGAVLSGYEVKSARKSNISLVDSVVRFSNGEAFADNVFIAPYEHMSSHVSDYDAKRKRKLLMRKDEINKFSQKIKEKGLTAIPLEVYISPKGKIKFLVGLGKGKAAYDKKETIKAKDVKRDLAREGVRKF
ncbi:SsrA-binding protein SmpB [Endomicrobium proavitum]|uniref:SsrA-binding protein n=1 Tax=Endomicrobium proavitum TaxID=1408281 RepID=A0A0G3WL80_9BACT|nr:SsrA-binding protein SmpB [Endomicrobium proavitum]AKL98259.1 SsrA-binding protein [Endomicrobium proavitum]